MSILNRQKNNKKLFLQDNGGSHIMVALTFHKSQSTSNHHHSKSGTGAALRKHKKTTCDVKNTVRALPTIIIIHVLQEEVIE